MENPHNYPESHISDLKNNLSVPSIQNNSSEDSDFKE